MALSGESLNVILVGFTLLLPTNLQITRVARLHVRALNIASEGLLESSQQSIEFPGKWSSEALAMSTK
jgi:hypothetical protein